MILAVTQSISSQALQILHESGSREYLIHNGDDDDENDNDDDDNDDYSCNSVNFQVRTSRFWMEIDPHKNVQQSLLGTENVKTYNNLSQVQKNVKMYRSISR